MARLTLLGVGAARTPRYRAALTPGGVYAPSGLLIEHGGDRVMIDGGVGASPTGVVDAWLVTDAHAESMPDIRALAWKYRLEPEVADFARDDELYINPRAILPAAHPTFGYLVELEGVVLAWAPTFLELPDWADDVDLLFAEAAAWNRPALLVGGAFGHAAALTTARQAEARGVKRLVFAHIGRPTIRATEAGQRPTFGELGHDGQVFLIPPRERPKGLSRRPRARGPITSDR